MKGLLRPLRHYVRSEANHSIRVIVKNSIFVYSICMLEEIKLPVEQLREEIMNVWGRL